MTARKPRRPRVPSSLAKSGKALWKSILDDAATAGLALDAREIELLARACRCADEIHELDAAVDRDGVLANGSRGQPVPHPALAESRQLRLLQSKLLGAIELAEPRGSDQPATPASVRARRAAETRWARNG